MVVKYINSSNNPEPSYKHDGDSGFDLRAFLDSETHIMPKETKVIPTGLFFDIPIGYELQVRSRSGLASSISVFVLNSPGTVDASYKGEIKIIVHNSGDTLFVINNGDRVAQGVVCPVIRAEFKQVVSVGKSDRGSAGFGSTGIK